MVCVPQPVLALALCHQPHQEHSVLWGSWRSSGSPHYRAPPVWVLAPQEEGFSSLPNTEPYLLWKHCESYNLLFPFLKWSVGASKLNLMFLKKLNIEFPYEPAFPLPLWVYTQKIWKQEFQQIFVYHVHSSIIYNGQKIEATLEFPL